MPSASGVKTILVADDDPGLLHALTDILRDEGYAVIPARDGLEAVALALEVVPDLLLVDVTMPRLDGQEAARRVRAAGLRDVPVVLMSAGISVQGLDGNTMFLPKPFDLGHLLRIVFRRIGPPRRFDGPAP
jgi:DNA-binding response OmpR family regulator